MAGNSLIVGDFQYPGEPNGRIIVYSSSWILDWLGERHLEGLNTINRVGVDATFKVPISSSTSEQANISLADAGLPFQYHRKSSIALTS